MGKNLSQIVAELFAKPAEGKELSSQIQRLGVEIRNVVQSEETVFGKFHGLLKSLREVIPDEQQRYQAALKALSTTAKMSRQEIIKAINAQLEEMKIVEKSVLPSLPAWRAELKVMEARAQERKAEITKLRERIAQLENEERTALAAMAAREKDLETAEKTIQDIFANIRAEIASFSKKVEELPAEGPEAQPAPAAPQTALMKPDAPAGKKESGSPAAPVPAPVDPKFQRKCPMCGGQFNLLGLQNIWQCFNCAYEEPAADKVQVTREEKKSEPVDTPPAQDLWPDPDRYTAPEPTPEPEPVEHKPASFVEPLADMSEYQRPTKASSSSGKQQIKKKPCPACKKKMFWYPEENAWRCPDCNYERRSLS